jgi:alpha-tubulin suppressor-like RCC1 family protein
MGTESAYVLNNLNKLFSWGYNAMGQLGNNSVVTQSSMVAVLGVSSFTLVSVGERNVAAITNLGRLFTWGMDNLGQLGTGTTTNAQGRRSSPTQVGTSSWTFVSMGGTTTFGVKLDGTLWAWGSDQSGQFGNGSRVTGTSAFRSSPVQVQTGTTWTKLLTSGYIGDPTLVTGTAPLGIKGGQLFAWGILSIGGAPLNPTTNYRSSPTQVDAASAVVSTYSYTSSPIQIGTDSQWTGLYGGADHVVAVDLNGGLYGWGSNEYGQLGTGDTVRRSSPIQIASALQESGIFVGYDVIAGAYDTFYSKPTA